MNQSPVSLLLSSSLVFPRWTVKEAWDPLYSLYPSSEGSGKYSLSSLSSMSSLFDSSVLLSSLRNFRLTLVRGGRFRVRGCGGRSVLNDAVFLYGCLVVLEGGSSFLLEWGCRFWSFSALGAYLIKSPASRHQVVRSVQIYTLNSNSKCTMRTRAMKALSRLRYRTVSTPDCNSGFNTTYRWDISENQELKIYWNCTEGIYTKVILSLTMNWTHMKSKGKVE